MSKKLKVLGVGVAATAVAGLAMYVYKKYKEADDFKLPKDYKLNEDDFDEDDFGDCDFDACDFTEDDFMDEETFFGSLDREDDIANTLNMSYDVAKSIILASDLNTLSSEDLDSITVEEFILHFEGITREDEAKDTEVGCELDTFKMINGYTREEVVDILVSADSVVYDRDTLLAMSDGELTQVYTDYKVTCK